MSFHSVTGFLGKNAEVRVHNDKKVLSFSIASHRKYPVYDQSGNFKENRSVTTWYNASFWNKNEKLVNRLSEILASGTEVSVTSKIMKTRAWLDEGGKPQSSLEILIQNWDDVFIHGLKRKSPNTVSSDVNSSVTKNEGMTPSESFESEEDLNEAKQLAEEIEANAKRSEDVV